MKLCGLILTADDRHREPRLPFEARSLCSVVHLQPMQAGDVPATYADISAIRADLGYAPTTSIEVGVPNFVRWYKDYHRL